MQGLFVFRHAAFPAGYRVEAFSNDVGTELMTSVEKQTTSDSQPVTGRFAGKVALITGASDQGIGGAIAERLAREGAAVSLASLDEPQRLIKKLARLQHGVVSTQCDVRKQDDVRRAVDDCMDEFGKIDVLVNNAGIELAQPFGNSNDNDEWQDLVDVNLNGVIRMTQAALPHLAQPGGAIVNVASALALAGCPGFSIYSASKAGLVGLTQSLAWELAANKQRVTCVAPAMVETPMTFKHIQHFTPKAQQQIDACHPLGTGSPHDVAAAVAFLASDDARWITGVTLPLGWAQNYPLPTQPFMSS